MNGRPRSEVQRDLDLLQRELAEYHRWLTEFPQVCRVLENLSLRIGAPLPGASTASYRSISNLREELRAHGVKGRPTISREAIAEWRALQGQGMTSAVGEYTPAEFWTLLEAYEALVSPVADRVALPVRVLDKADPYCPKCGHNRDRSSVSSVDEGEGRQTCQQCGTGWREVVAFGVTGTQGDQP